MYTYDPGPCNSNFTGAPKYQAASLATRRLRIARAATTSSLFVYECMRLRRQPGRFARCNKGFEVCLGIGRSGGRNPSDRRPAPHQTDLKGTIVYACAALQHIWDKPADFSGLSKPCQSL